MFTHPQIIYSKEVQKALNEKKPLCALESTIISHGMPYPENLETAKELEELVRQEGTTPATIAILKGKIHIGLDDEALELLAQGKDIEKVTTRSIPLVMAQGKHGATTVAATIHIANLAGISVMATGGIGGVHRMGETTMDISADLTELSRAKVAVVCAGVKSILDIGKTLEYLETLSVPVIGYQTKEFPAFYTRESGFEADFQMDKVEEIARSLKYKWELGQLGGALIGNPVPEKDAMPSQEIDSAIKKALKECDEKKITGKAITPYLLSAIKMITEGKSLKTNIALVKNNATLGGKIAYAIHRFS